MSTFILHLFSSLTRRRVLAFEQISQRPSFSSISSQPPPTYAFQPRPPSLLLAQRSSVPVPMTHQSPSLAQQSSHESMFARSRSVQATGATTSVKALAARFKEKERKSTAGPVQRTKQKKPPLATFSSLPEAGKGGFIDFSTVLKPMNPWQSNAISYLFMSNLMSCQIFSHRS